MVSEAASLSRYRWVILIVAVMCQAGASLGGQILAPLAPLFQPEFGMTKAQVGMFAVVSYAGATSVLLVSGSLTDRFGVRLIGSLGLAVTGGFMLAMVPASTIQLAALVMFAVGVGRGLVFPGSTKAIMEWFPLAARATAMGLKQTGAPLAGMVAAAVLPAVGLALGWRVSVALAGAAIVGLGALTAALYRDPGGSAAVIVHKPGVRAGMRDILKNRTLWILGSVACFFVMAQQAMLTYLALYLKEVVLVAEIPEEGPRVVAAGGLLAVCQAGGVFGRVYWGMMADRWFRGRRIHVLVLIGIVSACAATGLGQLGDGSPAWLLSPAVFVAGATLVGWNGVYHTIVAESVGRQQTATGAGLSLTLIEGGTIVGPPVFGLVVDMSGSYGSGWMLLAALALAGSGVATLLALRK